jgi:hypothetical protein
MDLTLGVTIDSIYLINESWADYDLLSGVSPLPVIHSYEDFYDLMVFLGISTTFTQTDVGTFAGNTQYIFQSPNALKVTFQGNQYYIVQDGSSLPTPV